MENYTIVYPSNTSNLQFYFSNDYTINGIANEVNRTLLKRNYDYFGDWTRVPIIKHKYRLRKCNLWNKKEG